MRRETSVSASPYGYQVGDVVHAADSSGRIAVYVVTGIESCRMRLSPATFGERARSWLAGRWASFRLFVLRVTRGRL